MGVDQEVRPQADLVTRRPRQRVFRKDIEGLRAVAILAVVLYHAHVGALPGGYVGVRPRAPPRPPSSASSP